MAIQFINANTAFVESAVTTITLTKPTNTANGDVMITSFALRPNTATITTLAGWTLIRTTTNANATAHLIASYYKVAANEGASYAWTLAASPAGCVGGICSFRGVAGNSLATSINLDNGNTISVGSANIPTADLTTTVRDTFLVTAHGGANNNTYTAPAAIGGDKAMDERVDNKATTAQIMLGMFTCDHVAAGATGVKTAVDSLSPQVADVGTAQCIALMQRLPVTSVRSVIVANPLVGPPVLRRRLRELRQRLPWTVAGAGGTVFNQAVAGTLSFIGALTRVVAKKMTAGLSFIGALKRDINKKMTAGLSFIGTLKRDINKKMTAGLSFIGTLKRDIATKLTAALSFIGALATAKFAAKALTGTLSFIGTNSRFVKKTMTAALTFIGTVAKLATLAVAPTAALSFIGAIATAKFAAKALTATLNFAGNLNRDVAKKMTATLSFVGALKRDIAKQMTATLSFVGALKRDIAKKMTAALSFIGAIATAKFVALALAATLSFTGTLKRDIAKQMTATLSFIGALVKRTAKGLTAAALSFIGAITTQKFLSQALAGTLSFIGAVSTRTTFSKVLTATLSFIGAINVFVAKKMTAALSFIGATAKRTAKGLTAAALSFIGALASQKFFSKVLTATLSFVGAITRRVSSQQAGTLSFVGATSRFVAKKMTAGLSFVGATAKRTAKGLAAAALSFVGALSRVSIFGKALTATLSFVGAQTRRISKMMAATLSFSGFLSGGGRLLLQSLSGILSFSDSVFGSIVKRLSGLWQVALRARVIARGGAPDTPVEVKREEITVTKQ